MSILMIERQSAVRLQVFPARVIACVLALLLAGCSNRHAAPDDALQRDWHWPLPATLWLQVAAPAAPVQDYLLVLQDESGILRASLFDPAGLPVARKRLRDGHWRNEGLLPPHAAVEDWLTAIVHSLTNGMPLAGESVQLELPDGSKLQVRQLESP